MQPMDNEKGWWVMLNSNTLSLQPPHTYRAVAGAICNVDAGLVALAPHGLVGARQLCWQAVGADNV